MNTVRRSTTGPYLGDAMRTLFQGIRHRPLRNKARQGDQGTRAGWERSRFRTANLEAADLGVHRSGWITVVVSHWPGHLEVMPFAPTP